MERGSGGVSGMTATGAPVPAITARRLLVSLISEQKTVPRRHNRM